MTQSLLSHTIDQLRSFAQDLGEKPYRGDQLFEWIHQKRAASFDEMTSLSQELREKLSGVAAVRTMTIEHDALSVDGTHKYALRLPDGPVIESVLIPAENDAERLTLCVSTQVGCPLDCVFCATGTMGFTRNLTVSEILEQYLLIQGRIEERISNVVYMGMGEPMMNYENVMASVEMLMHPQGAGIGARHITLSTAGYAQKIRTMADEKRRIRLALSLHSLVPAVRSRLMPITKKHSIAELTDALRYYFEKTRQRPTLEYILFEGVNDSEQDIEALVSFVQRVPSKVNIIPFHSISFTNPGAIAAELRPASKDRILWFAEKLREKDVTVMVRSSSGEDIKAACGQLATAVGSTSYAPEADASKGAPEISSPL
jgi:23S rRNA (adenine2503-C2)-methyltransferase